MGKRKLFYVPGLISLIGLPILLFILYPTDVKLENSLRLNLMPKEVTDIHSSAVRSLHDMLKKKKIEQVFLNDYIYDEREQYQFERKLIFIKNELERLQFTHDTSTVIKIIFGEENTYGQFVNLVDIAVIYSVKRYVYVNDDFYFFANELPALLNKDAELIGIPYGSLPQPRAWNIFTWKIEYEFYELYYSAKQNAWLAIGFLVLIIIPSVIKFIRKKSLSSF